MAHGNINVQANDGLFYVSYEKVNIYRGKNNKTDYRMIDDIPIAETHEFELDQKLSQSKYENYIKDFKARMTKRFKSFKSINRHDKGRHLILTNEMFFVAIEDNEWSFAVELLSKKTQKTGLQRNLFKSFYKGIAEILLEITDEIYIRSGTWSQVQITKENINEILDDKQSASKIKVDKKGRATTLYPPPKSAPKETEARA